MNAAGDDNSRNDVIKYVRGVSRDAMFEVKKLSTDPTGEGGPALREISFSLFAAETLAIIGDGGKSALAQLLARHQPLAAGSITLNGEDAATMPAGRYSRAVQLAGGGASLSPYKLAWQIVADPLAVRTTMPAAKRRHQAEQVMAELGLLPQVYEALPRHLSVAERYIVGLARALVLKPAVLICDGTADFLAPNAKAMVLNRLVALQQQQQLSIIFIGHDLQAVHHFCDRVMVIKDGAIVEYGSRRDIFREPEDPYTRALIAAIPR